MEHISKVDEETLDVRLFVNFENLISIQGRALEIISSGIPHPPLLEISLMTKSKYTSRHAVLE